MKAKGGIRAGAGRKPLGNATIVAIRLTPEHRRKLRALGGSKWVREQIERAVL